MSERQIKLLNQVVGNSKGEKRNWQTLSAKQRGRKREQMLNERYARIRAKAEEKARFQTTP